MTINIKFILRQFSTNLLGVLRNVTCLHVANIVENKVFCKTFGKIITDAFRYIINSFIF